MQVYGADKIWRQMNGEGEPVARCAVALDAAPAVAVAVAVAGCARGKRIRTTNADKSAACPLNRVNRQYNADRSNQLWVQDFTYVSTWQGWLYVAFVIDVFVTHIVG